MLSDFREIVLIDFEFKAPVGGQQIPVCSSPTSCAAGGASASGKMSSASLRPMRQGRMW